MTRPIETLEPHEVSTLLAWVQHFNSSYDAQRARHRNYLIFLLMLDAGIRVGELVQLQIRDLWINERPVDSLVIRPEIAKGGRERIIPISSRLCRAIACTQEYVWPTAPFQPNDWAFSKWMSISHHSTRQIQRIVKVAGESALRKRLTPHMLRHTFATRLMRQTNIRVVQELLGHRRLSSTQIYTHPNHADLKKAIDGL